MIDYDTSEISELESRLLMLYEEDEYKILFNDLAYIVFEPNELSIHKRAGCVVDSSGNKITETVFDCAIPINNGSSILGYCLLMPEILGTYTDKFYTNNNGYYELKDRAPEDIKVPILKEDLTIDIARMSINRWKPSTPELILSYKFKKFISYVNSETGFIEYFK